jgi:hypothetical protein
LNITLLNINHSTKSDKKGKPYQLAEVAYKNNTYGGAIEGFKVTSFMKAYPDIAAAQIGETFEIAVEKQNGFNQWMSATKGVPGVSVQQPTGGGGVPKASASAPSSASTGYAKPANTYGKDFETREERAKKQVYIVRQSSIANAIALLSLGAKTAPKVGDVVAVARELETYIFEQQKLSGFEDMPSDFNPDYQTSQEPNLD